MASMTVIRNIRAPLEIVFETVADPALFAKAISGVTKTECLTEAKSGAGMRFRQSRMMNGKEMTMDFEVIECVPNQRVRIVNETHGTLWDSLITVARTDQFTTLNMRMDAKSRNLLPKIRFFRLKRV